MNVIPKALKHVAAIPYYVQRHAMMVGCVIGQTTLRKLTKRQLDPDPSIIIEAYERYVDLLKNDIENAASGYYPWSHLFKTPLTSPKLIAKMLVDLPFVFNRAQKHNFFDIPYRIDLSEYPSYYKRNFHWQTDGYFSKRSAQLYDVGVEFLFMGAADAMRRQVIPYATMYTKQNSRILDIGCGNGKFLHQLASTHPKVKFTGIDLSSHYIDYAKKKYSLSNVHFDVGNAERLPYEDSSFDSIISIYLFHELPKEARKNVYNEMLRVLKPGGVLVIEDSEQYSTAPKLSALLEKFSDDFHEPFHAHYLKEPIEDALRETGFNVVGTVSAFVAKVVIARRQ